MLQENECAKTPFVLTGEKQNPKDVNYSILGLYRKETYNLDGRLNNVELYKDYDGTTYSNIAVREDYTYYRNSSVFINKIQIDYIFYLIPTEDFPDESIVLKTENIYLTSREAIERGRQARQKIIDFATEYIVNQDPILANTLLLTLKNDIDWYVGGVKVNLIDSITNYDMDENYITGILAILNPQ